MFAVDHGFFQFVELVVDVIEGLFHFVNDLKQVVDCLFGLFDEIVNSWGLPLEFLDSGFYVFVHLDDPGLDEGFFDVVEAGHDSVVVLDDEFQGDHLTAVSISFFEDFLGCFGDTSVELFQIFDFSQEANQNRVKVDLQESVFFVFAAFVVANQEVFEFFMSVFVDFLLPKTDFGFFVVIDDLENILMQFLNIFVFFSFSDAFA